MYTVVIYSLSWRQFDLRTALNCPRCTVLCCHKACLCVCVCVCVCMRRCVCIYKRHVFIALVMQYYPMSCVACEMACAFCLPAGLVFASTPLPYMIYQGFFMEWPGSCHLSWYVRFVPLLEIPRSYTHNNLFSPVYVCRALLVYPHRSGRIIPLTWYISS